MVRIQLDGVQHFDPAKIITGAGVRVSDLSLDDALARLLSAIAATLQSEDTVDMNMAGSMFAGFTSTDDSTVVQTAGGLAVICKLATKRLWPATSADGAPHGGMRHLEGLIFLVSRQGAPPASPTLQHQSQQLSTPPPQEMREHGDRTLGKHPCNEPTDTNTGDTSGDGAALLTTTTPARQVRVRLHFSICFALRAHKHLGLPVTFHALIKRWLRSSLCPGVVET